MSRQPMIADKAVAVKTAPASIPASPRIIGLTKRIYAMETNVVRPARHSLFTVVLFSDK